MFRDNKILVGTGFDGRHVYMLPRMGVRHGLISGAEGSGKTTCVKMLAESFSDMGIPVFVTDIKGDLSGMCKAGQPSPENAVRLKKCGIEQLDFGYHGYPVIFWDAFGIAGHPVRTPVGNVHPVLMARLLEINEIQADVLEVVYRICKDEGIILDDLKDLVAALLLIGSDPERYRIRYGLMSPQTLGVIQNRVFALDQRGGSVFFGRPEINAYDWLCTDQNGKGLVNILNAKHLFMNSNMYATFLLWLLSELNRILPERGNADKPVLVLFLDEAHLLFRDCSQRLMARIEEMIRLMRSKGVGVFLQTAYPLEIPAPVDRQLHNRIQLSMNAYTPLEQQKAEIISRGYPFNPDLDIYSAICHSEIGEGVVTFPDREGVPGRTEKVTILPPQSQKGQINDKELAQAIGASPFRGKYDQVIDYYSAYEKLTNGAKPSLRDLLL